MTRPHIVRQDGVMLRGRRFLKAQLQAELNGGVPHIQSNPGTSIAESLKHSKHSRRRGIRHT